MMRNLRGETWKRARALRPRRMNEREPTLRECKAMAQVTLSCKNQIVIPREAREALGVKAGDQLLVVVRGEKVIVIEKPKPYHKAIRGLGAGVYSAGHLAR